MTTESLEKVVSPLNPRTGNHRGTHPNSLKALEENRVLLQPGEVINPKGYSLVRRALDKLEKDEVCPYDVKGRAWSEVLPEDLLRHAHLKTEGMRTLLDRIEGPVTETPPVMIDNRQITFIVQGDDAKEKMEQLLTGKPKELGSG